MDHRGSPRALLRTRASRAACAASEGRGVQPGPGRSGGCRETARAVLGADRQAPGGSRRRAAPGRCWWSTSSICPERRTARPRSRALYSTLGYQVLLVSASSGRGLEDLSEELCRGTSALVGPSGAGKSSLLNALDSSLALRVGELSGKGGRGRHTTVSSPADRTVVWRIRRGLRRASATWRSGASSQGIWTDAFPEITGRVSECRFRSCAHQDEPGCAVRKAVEQAEIVSSRYESYRKLRAEADEARVALGKLP